MSSLKLVKRLIVVMENRFFHYVTHKHDSIHRKPVNDNYLLT